MSFRGVLVIDDEQDIRDIAAIALEMTRGWEVQTASCGARGIETACAVAPDVILLDVMMPGMDGPATLRCLQSNESTRQIPVIFLTAKVQPADILRFTKLGVRGVISKPFDPMRLADLISEFLNWPPDVDVMAG